MPLLEAIAIDPRDEPLALKAAASYQRLGRDAEAWELISRRG